MNGGRKGTGVEASLHYEICVRYFYLFELGVIFSACREPALVGARQENLMLAMKWTLAFVAVIASVITNGLAEGSDPNQVDCMKKSIQTEPPVTDKSDPNYWTKERMKSAKPIEMPTPDEPAPVGQDKTPYVDSNKSVSGEGSTGGTNVPVRD